MNPAIVRLAWRAAVYAGCVAVALYVGRVAVSELGDLVGWAMFVAAVLIVRGAQ